MIDDSVPWKKEIWRTATRLNRWRSQKRFSAASYFALEKEIFFAFYAIRKLLETETKISHNVRDMQTTVHRYNANGRRKADRLHWDKIDEIFDLSVKAKEQMSLLDLCNKFVHSYVFMPVRSEIGLAAILFNTDREKNLALYEIDIVRIQRILELVAHDDIVSMRLRRQPDGEFKVVRSSNKLSSEERSTVDRTKSKAH